MKVLLVNHYTGRERVLEASPGDMERDLLDLFPYLRSPNLDERGDLGELIDHIDSMQGFTAEVIEGGLKKAEGEPDGEQGTTRNLVPDGGMDTDHPVVRAMLGEHTTDHVAAFEAAAFLAGHPGTPLERMRRALWDEDGDYMAAALRVHGLEPTEPNLRALKAVLDMGREGRPMTKAEQAIADADVRAVTPEGEDTAAAVRKAFEDRFVFPVRLGGKHSAGSMLAKDEESGKVFLLKPGAGGQSPAAGAQEQPATQSQREVGFWYAADKMGLSQWLPRADLVIIDGKQYAAMHLIPWSFKTLDDRRKEDPQLPQRLFHPFLSEGLIHRWAAMDFILGNPDRHANNVMVGEDGEIQLIDHGSALAGKDFDPPEDKNSFVPYYLRAWCPSPKFQQMPPEEKLTQLPRVSDGTAKDIGEWLAQIRAVDLEAVLYRYGADPAPILIRLAQLKALALSHPADEAINMVWSGVV